MGRKGFTQIELLVVVVIIGILASVAMPNFQAAQDRARNAAAGSTLMVVRQGLELFASDNNGNYPFKDEVFTATGLCQHNYLPGNRAPRSPWSAVPQTVRIMPTIPPMITIEEVTATTAKIMPDTPCTPATAGSVGIPAPTVITHFGAISTDTENNTASNQQRDGYVAYVTGKKGKNCVVAGSITNFGL